MATKANREQVIFIFRIIMLSLGLILIVLGALYLTGILGKEIKGVQVTKSITWDGSWGLMIFGFVVMLLAFIDYLIEIVNAIRGKK